MKNPHFVSFLKVGYSCRCISPFRCIILLFCIHVNRFLSIQIAIPLYSLHVIILTKKLFIHFNLNIVCGVFYSFLSLIFLCVFFSEYKHVCICVIEHQHIWAFFLLINLGSWSKKFKILSKYFKLFLGYMQSVSAPARKCVPVPFIFC